MKQNDGGVDVAAVMTEIERFGRAYCAYARGGNHEDLEEATRIYDGIPALLASPAAVGWIPVSERLPDISRAVNVYCNGADASGVAWRLPDDSWFIPEPQAIGYESITHWQPLPSPPAIASQEVGNG